MVAKENPQQIQVSIEMNSSRTEVCIIFTCSEPMESDQLYQALETLIRSHGEKTGEDQCAH